MPWLAKQGPSGEPGVAVVSAGPIDAADRAADILGSQTLWFEPNQGQADDWVVFQARGFGYGIGFSRQAGVVLAVEGSRPLRMDLVNADDEPRVVGEDQLDGVSNYLIGSDRDGWRTGIPHFGRVKYEQVYPGIDLAFYGNQGLIEYDFVVAPGADPSQIRVAIEGAEDISIASNGDLTLAVSGGSLIQKAPVLYQELEGRRRPVEGSFRLVSSDTDRVVVGFELGNYDPGLPLVIDPKIDYSTYLGGSDLDYGFDVALSAGGTVYVVGRTASLNFPTSSALDGGRNGGSDAFITRFRPGGETLVYSTYLGGSGGDQARAVAVDSGASAYIVGSTSSTDFPTVNAYQPTFGGYFQDAFVARLNASGSALVFATYWGGSTTDEGRGIDLDTSGDLYVTGYTASSDFPTESASQGTKGGVAGRDAFVSKFNNSGTVVHYSTYLGGGDDDFGRDIAVNSVSQAFVAGTTRSSDFPTKNAVQTSLRGTDDAFIAKLSDTGARIFSTYLGGSAVDGAGAVALGPSENPYISGGTHSNNFPTVDAYQPTHGGMSDAFVARLSTSGAITYSTYLGGSGDDQGNGIAVDSGSRPHVVGSTDSTDFPLSEPIQDTYGGGNSDVMAFLLDASGGGLLYSTYLGGVAGDSGHSVAVDSSYQAYITGSTFSTNFPTENAFQPTKPSTDSVAFLTKLNTSPILDFFIAAVPVKAAQRSE